MSSELDHDEALAHRFTTVVSLPRSDLGVATPTGDIAYRNRTGGVIEIDDNRRIIDSSQWEADGEDDEYEDDGYGYDDELEHDELGFK